MIITRRSVYIKYRQAEACIEIHICMNTNNKKYMRNKHNKINTCNSLIIHKHFTIIFMKV